MLLTRYQQTDIMIGTFVFGLLYFIYRSYITKSQYIYFDVLYCTVGVFLIFFLKYFAVNYFELYQTNI